MSFTKNFFTISLAALTLAILCTLGGCATDETLQAEHAGAALPWNRPAKWEGPGVMGSAMQGTQ